MNVPEAGMQWRLTRSGERVHAAFAGSNRALCGVKVAGRLAPERVRPANVCDRCIPATSPLRRRS